MLKPTEGSIRVDGFDPVRDQGAVRRTFGIVFQDPSLDEALTAFENMELHAVLYRVDPRERRGRIEKLLRFVELWNRRADFVKRFSGGMKRRLEIARALLHEPKIIFLDEPTLGLDPQTRNHIWSYIENLSKERDVTVFFTTHYMEEADRVADEIAVIDHGKIVAQGSPASLKERVQTVSLEDAFIALTGHATRVVPGIVGLRFWTIVPTSRRWKLSAVSGTGGHRYGNTVPCGISGIEIIWDRQFGFLKETLVAPV
jgi:ABC-2 type transport system ATP-binding protein